MCQEDAGDDRMSNAGLGNVGAKRMKKKRLTTNSLHTLLVVCDVGCTKTDPAYSPSTRSSKNMGRGHIATMPTTTI